MTWISHQLFAMSQCRKGDAARRRAANSAVALREQLKLSCPVLERDGISVGNPCHLSNLAGDLFG